VQNDVRLEVAVDDAGELDETLNDTIVRWIVEYNMPGAGLPKLERVFEEPEDLAKRATRDKTLVDMGWEPSEEYMLDTYGEGWTRRKPEPVPEELLPGAPGGGGAAPGAAAETPGADEEDPRFAEGLPLQRAGAQRAFNRAQQDTLAAAADELAGHWQELMGKQFEDLISMLEETGDLVQFRERLDELLERPPADAAVETVARATFAGALMGRGMAQRRTFGAKLRGLLGRRGGR
jgi:phage gp29-like protein